MIGIFYFLLGLISIHGYSLCEIRDQPVAYNSTEGYPPYIWVESVCSSYKMYNETHGAAIVSMDIHNLNYVYHFNKPNNYGFIEAEIRYCFDFYSELEEHQYYYGSPVVTACIFHLHGSYYWPNIEPFFAPLNVQYPWQTRYETFDLYQVDNTLKFKIENNTISLEVPLNNLTDPFAWSFTIRNIDSHSDGFFYDPPDFPLYQFDIESGGTSSCSLENVTVCVNFDSPNPVIAIDNCSPSFSSPSINETLELCKVYKFPQTFSEPSFGCGSIVTFSSEIYDFSGYYAIYFDIELNSSSEYPNTAPDAYTRCFLNLFFNQDLDNKQPTFSFRRRMDSNWELDPSNENSYPEIQYSWIYSSDRTIEVNMESNQNPLLWLSRFGIESKELSPNNQIVWISGMCARPPPSFTVSNNPNCDQYVPENETIITPLTSNCYAPGHDPIQPIPPLEQLSPCTKATGTVDNELPGCADWLEFESSFPSSTRFRMEVTLREIPITPRGIDTGGVCIILFLLFTEQSTGQTQDSMGFFQLGLFEDSYILMGGVNDTFSDFYYISPFELLEEPKPQTSGSKVIFEIQSTGTITNSIRSIQLFTALVFGFTTYLDSLCRPNPFYSIITGCSLDQLCPVDCGNGICAPSAELCPEPECTNSDPFPCLVSGEIVCVASPSICNSLSPPTGNCSTEFCWNGQCRPNTTPFCPDVPSCPLLSKRCSDGRCVEIGEDCGQDNTCPGQIRCPTGECVDRLRDCPAWNGCPPPDNPSLTISCPSGRCVANVTLCNCENGKFRCFDRTCRDSPSDCPKPPAAIKLLPVSWNLATNQERTLAVIAQGSKQPILNISIPAGTFSSTKRNCPTQVISMACSAVSDSKLREYRLPTWDPDTESFENYFSPAWDLNVDDCIPRPFPEDIVFTLTIQYSGNKDDLALLFLNQGETTEWQISGQNLDIVDNGNGTLFITARTNHFTSFIIGFSPKESKDEEDKDKKTIDLTIIVGVGAGVLVLITIFIVMIILLKKNQTKRKRKFEQETFELEQASNDSKYQSLRSFLEEIELLQYLPIFVKNEITYDNLITFEQEKLVELGLPLGVAKKIYTAYSSLREKKYLNTKDIKVGERIGGGAYGEVYRGTYLANKVALKKLQDSIQTQEFLAESKLLQKLRHPNVVIFFGIYKSPEGEQYMVSELLSLGSLKHLLKEKSSSLETYELVHMAVMTAAGMSYLAENNIVHCDLATRNLLVKLEDDEYLVKVSDFGLSKHNINSEITSSKDTKYPVKWTAPEAFGGVFTTKSDIWSFGVVLYEIFTFGGEPYPEMGNKEVFEKVKEGYRMAQPLGCPDSIYKVMLNCWAEDPKKRPEFSLLYEQLSLLQKEEFPLKKNDGKETTIPINESKPSKKTTEDTYSVTPADQPKKEELRYTNDLS